MSTSFHAHVALLQTFLARRADIVACIDRLLNCQKKPVEYQQDLPLLSRQFADCFFALGGLSAAQTSLRGHLEQAHLDSGFKPRAQPGNALVDPAEQMLRAFHMWRQTRWPGQAGRLRFAHTLFNLQIVRSLALLCMRLWDEDASGASARLTQAQAILDALWQGSTADQPRLVRDLRWLFPVAMSPTTDSLAGYFAIAERIATTFGETDRIEIQRAWVVTGAGHLRSQLRDLARRRGVAFDEHALVLLTRVSNALDVSLLMEGLVTLLAAYEHALHTGDQNQRFDLASAILQGISPDPELFVNRLDLLGPYTMIEHLFIASEAGTARYTAAGARHVALLAQYCALMMRLAPALHADCAGARPVEGAWSPYGILYGFASNLLELTAFKALQHEAPTHFSMEEAFTAGDAAKLAWVNGWRQLPHIRPDVVQQFEYPRQFAEDVYSRIEQALQHRVAGIGAQAGRLYVVPEDSQQALTQAPDLPSRYIVSSDPHWVASRKAEAKADADLLHCRNEGEFLVSFQTANGWVALTKDLLTDVLGTGLDAKVALPSAAAQLVRAMCPDLATIL